MKTLIEIFCQKLLVSNVTLVFLDHLKPKISFAGQTWKPMIKNKLKEFLSELKKFKVQKILVLEYNKRNDCKIFHSCTKLIASNSDIEEAFKSIH